MPGDLIGRLELPGGHLFEAVVYDLLYEPSDCIVNAANGGLSHGGGIAFEISQAAGREFDEECRRLVQARGRVAVGEAVVTGAGKLPFKGVIHAVGPSLGQGDEENKLAHTVQAALLRAHERGWKSLSFPALSSGLYAVPYPVCARAYVRAVREFFEAHRHASLRTVRLVLVLGPLVELVRKELQARPSPPSSPSGRAPQVR